MRKTELMVSGEVIHPKTKASIVSHEHTNIEAYLDQQNRTSSVITQSSSMSRVGLGDNEDLSFCVEDGFYENATLYGKTLVNRIQESSSQDIVLPYEFAEGPHVTINDTKESGALGVELKGRTLVNVVDVGTLHHENAWIETNNGDSLSLNIPSTLTGQPGIFVNFLHPLKKNTEYTIIMKMESHETGHPHVCLLDDASSHAGDRELVPPTTGFMKEKLRTSSTKEAVTLRVIPRYGEANAYTFSKKIMVLEGDYTNVDIPYFEGMASVKSPTVKTVGKNLFNHTDNEKICRYIGGSAQDNYTLYYTVQQSTITVTGQPLHTYVLGYKLPLQHDKSITISASSGLGDLLYYRYYGKNFTTLPNVWQEVKFYAGDDEKKYVTFKSTEYPVDAEYVLLGIGNAGKSDYVINNLQIEYGETVTTYEPYKSSSLTLPSEEVILRSLPNGVCDTFNTRTGEYVRRIGEYTFNGNASWSNVFIDNKTIRFITYSIPNNLILPFADNLSRRVLNCDRLQVSSSHELWNEDTEGISKGQSGGDIRIRLNKDKLDTHDANGLNKWLQANQITIQYQLATPIVTKIDLPSTLKSWNATTHIYSEIPENTLYPILSHSNPTYPVILKPSTKYSIVANSYSNNHANSPIYFDLGGATASTTVGRRVTTVTTPSTLENKLLTMSGRGNKLSHVMVIEGEVVGDETYFEGIRDVKSPTLTNVGGNLFNVNGELTKCGYSHGIPCITYEQPNLSIDSQREFTISTSINGYNRGFGQHIDISSLDEITVEATALFTGAKTNTECKVLLLHENESLPSFIKYEDAKHYTVRTLTFTTSGQRLSVNIDTSQFAKMFIMFCGEWKNEVSGIHVFTMKDVYVGSPNQTYEPCKSNVTTFNNPKPDGEVVLRSLPNGARDTLNIKTGEYVRRIGEIVLNGSESSWAINSYNPYNNGTHYQFKYWLGTNAIKDGLWLNEQCILSDTLPSADWTLHWDGKGSHGIGGDREKIMITWEKGSSPFYDVDTLKAWLRKNPTTVQYELDTPIVSVIDVQGFPYAYKDGYVQLSSGHHDQSLTPKLEYVIQANRAGVVQANQDRLINHEKRFVMLETMMLHQLIQLEYRRAKHMFLSQMRQVSEGGVQMHHTKYDLLLAFIEKKLYRSLEEVLEMLDVYFMLGDITDGEYDLLYGLLLPAQMADEKAPEEDFNDEQVEV